MEPTTVLVYILRPVDAVSGVGCRVKQASTGRSGHCGGGTPVPLVRPEDHFASACHASWSEAARTSRERKGIGSLIPAATRVAVGSRWTTIYVECRGGRAHV